MASPPPTPPTPEPQSEQDKDLFLSLRRKQGTWVEWGQSCQQLQKSGYSQQRIFEETGFEPIQQNQIIVGSQVYQSIVSGGAAASVLERFERTGSDSLYEFRVLNQSERVAAATLVVEKEMDSVGAHEVAKALKEYGRLSKPPEDFAAYPDDAVAYYYWRFAREQGDLQARSRLIAQGLQFAKSTPARQAIEKLLTDFTVSKKKQAPKLPFYRLESATDQPRIIPVVGHLPLTVEDLQAVPFVDEDGPFHLVKFSGTGAWVAFPSWQVVLGCEDPVAILADSDQLVSPPTDNSEDVLVILDRAQRQWEDSSYFVVDQAGQLKIDWFEIEPNQPILGRVILVLRPKRVLDEDFNKQLWQMDE